MRSRYVQAEDHRCFIERQEDVPSRACYGEMDKAPKQLTAPITAGVGVEGSASGGEPRTGDDHPHTGDEPRFDTNR